MFIYFVLQAVAAAVPTQNRDKPELKTIQAYAAEPLLAAVQGEPTAEARAALFFPSDAFDQLKGIKDPGTYHKQLLKWFDADLAREKARLSPKGPWTIKNFKLGSCKWKEKGSQANALPYWSCYKSKMNLENTKGEKESLEVRTLINWGDRWFITHLGPIPKS